MNVYLDLIDTYVLGMGKKDLLTDFSFYIFSNSTTFFKFYFHKNRNF